VSLDVAAFATSAPVGVLIRRDDGVLLTGEVKGGDGKKVLQALQCLAQAPLP
jgi:hypothetical protein